MKLLALVAVVILVIGVAFVVLQHRRSSSGLKFKTTDQFIQYMAAQAVQDAEQQDHIKLDYSRASIQKVEEILGRLHEQYAKDSASVSATALGSAYGAYVGEVIRRSEPDAKWQRDDPVAGEKSYPLIWRAGHSYPMAWCYHRIVNGQEDNVWIKYQVLEGRTADPVKLK